jgi:hypothetical protein
LFLCSHTYSFCY